MNEYRVSAIVLSVYAALSASALAVEIDLSRFRSDGPVAVERTERGLTARWPMDHGESGHLTLDLKSPESLIESLAISPDREGNSTTVLSRIAPATTLTIGQRNLERNGWTIFFDKVHTRPHETHLVQLDPQRVRVESVGEDRVRIRIDKLSAASFEGELVFTLYPGSRLIHVESVLTTNEDARAIVYDAGLVGSFTTPKARIGWMATGGEIRRRSVDPDAVSTPLAVRHRAIVAESGAGSVAVFPPPHQYFYPLDFSDNLEFVWYGASHRGVEDRFGIGIRHRLEGDRRFVPWFNAPPGTKQRLGVFYLLSRGDTAVALEEVKRYTRGDRFKRLPGHVTFSSHYHVEHTTDLIRRQPPGFELTEDTVDDVKIPSDLEQPGFVKVFREMGVDIVHLAEFHFGRTPRLSASERLPQLELMHRECARLSDDGFLLLPGEEPNVHFGGHWISFFPKPIFWILNRPERAPFVETHPRYGSVYHVGSAEDVLALLERERGLAWTAHPRIKSSTGYPDRYRTRDFYRSDRFLGAAWKAMPADLSWPRLGTRVLDLQDDMANWGGEKYILGEVDVFKVNPNHEQYAHMNINYLRTSKVPRFEDGWATILDLLRRGEYFVTTGEILIRQFTIDGKESGERLSRDRPERSKVSIDVEWTFPLAFAEIISGDGERTHRQRIDLTDTRPFGERTLEFAAPLRGRRWARVEVWDIAANGAFTMPVWIGETTPADARD